MPGGDLDWAALAGHFEAIRQTRTLPDERTRFLGQSENKARARRAVVAHALEADAGVYERIAAVATGAAPSNDGVFIEGGALWVRAKMLAEMLYITSGAERWDVPRVQRALGPIKGKRDVVWRAGKPVRAKEIDVVRLVEFCSLEAEAVRRTLAGEPLTKPED
jgi:hypothetical protein